MIPSLLDELKEGRFKLLSAVFNDFASFYHYKTESGWKVDITESMHTLIYVNGKKVSWFLGWKIRRAIKKGMKHGKV